jgi:hypothetical protein
MHALTDLNLYKIDHPLGSSDSALKTNDALGGLDEFSELRNSGAHQDVRCWSAVLRIEVTHLNRSPHMNIFYIIGVVVVIVVIAGFFGLHV